MLTKKGYIVTVKVGSILDFRQLRYNIDTGQKTSDSKSIFSILVELVKFQWMSQKNTLR